ALSSHQIGEALAARKALETRTEHAGQTNVTVTGLHAHCEQAWAARAVLIRVSAVEAGRPKLRGSWHADPSGIMSGITSSESSPASGGRQHIGCWEIMRKEWADCGSSDQVRRRFRATTGRDIRSVVALARWQQSGPEWHIGGNGLEPSISECNQCATGVMASKDDDEITARVAGVLAGIALAVVGVVYAVGGGKTMRVPAASSLEMVDMAPIGEPRAKVYFGVGKAELNEADGAVVATTVQALANKPQAIVLLSGFHDPSGDAAANARLAKARAVSGRTALLASGVEASRVKFLRKPESTIGSGSPEDGRRVEIRVQ
ncbi:MAG TPA: OmpA family protein, partial [Accumulibacter sp.]